MVAAPRRMPLRFTAFHLGIKAPETLTALDRIFAWSVIAMGAAFGLHRSSWQAARSPAVKTIPVFFVWLRLCPVQGRGLHPEEGPFGEELPKELQPLAGQELAGHGANVGTA